MSYLDSKLNNGKAWDELGKDAERRIEVDLHEIERVIELARRTPALQSHWQGLHQLSIFFAIATKHYQQTDPSGLTGLVEFWERYRASVMQRYAAVTPVELRAADKVVTDIFQRFLAKIPQDCIAYSPDATPLVYGGDGGLGGYFTHPPGWNRPFAIINLPHAAFDNVWQWLALPHETGHDTYATVSGLAEELEAALSARMRDAVDAKEVVVPAVDVDLAPHGVPHRIQYTPAEFLAKVWSNWANEAQADIIGLTSCGGAAAVALQQIIGFRAEDHWELSPAGAGFEDGPEVHPTSYVRNAFNIAALRLLGDGAHGGLADEMEKRFKALRPKAKDITWGLSRVLTVARVNVDAMSRSAEIAADVILNHKLQALGGQSYRDLGDFSAADQALVDQMRDGLLAGDPSFARVTGGTPRHALAATVLAFEQNRSKAALINLTFKHYV